MISPVTEWVSITVREVWNSITVETGDLQDSSSMETKGKTSLVENEDSDMGHFVGEHSSPHSHPFSQSEVHISMINCYLCKVKQLLVYHTPTLYFLVGIKSSTLANVWWNCGIIADTYMQYSGRCFWVYQMKMTLYCLNVTNVMKWILKNDSLKNVM